MSINRQPVCLIVLCWPLLLVVLFGCKSKPTQGICTTTSCGGEPTLVAAANRVEYADLAGPSAFRMLDTAPPLTSATELPEESLLLTLDQVIQLALENTEILRDLGARVLRNPDLVPGVFDPAIQATDPNYGIEAALSEFDARFTGDLNYANNDEVFNNDFIGGGSNQVQQSLTTSSFGISKISATGTQFAIRGNLQNDINNQDQNLFDNSWSSLFEAEMRQPLLQGRGLEFNRIAGPNARPGLRNSDGVLISRINNDISIAQFEQNVRRFVVEVIRAYWNLYLAYQNFESALAARDGSQETWNMVKARFDNDLPGGEADREAQAREQYFLFQGFLIRALNGDPQSTSPGVLQAESDLRRLLNLPQSDGRLIRPVDEPIVAEVAYDWYELAQHALDCRVELREQGWRLKRRELELLASRNFTLPRLDAVATYRNNGFGDDLWGGGYGQFASALKTANNLDYQEWEFGFLMDVPIGFRQASSGVRNAELKLERERRILDEQQKQVLQGLGTAVRQTDQTYASVQMARSRFVAALDTVNARKAAFDADTARFDEWLDAQRRLADADAAFHRETTNWMMATEAVARESGTLLSNHQVYVNEGATCNVAGVEVAERTCKVKRARELDYRSSSTRFAIPQ